MEYLLLKSNFQRHQLLGVESSLQAAEILDYKGIPHIKVHDGGLLKDEITCKPSIITMLDVIEHLEHPVDILSTLNRLSAGDSYVIITVPAYECLWSEWDCKLDHKRRYTKKTLHEILLESGWQTINTQYFFSSMFFLGFLRNILVSRSSLSNTEFPRIPAILNKWLTRFYDMESRLSRIPFGTSIITVAAKRHNY